MIINKINFVIQYWIMPRWLSLVERETCNLVVAGSIPVRGFNFILLTKFFHLCGEKPKPLYTTSYILIISMLSAYIIMCVGP